MSTWGNSWLESWGSSWDRVYVPAQTSGGAVIVDSKKKRRKKKAKKEIEDSVSKVEEITEEQAKGMAAVYGAMGGFDIVSKPEPVEEVEEIAEIEAVSEPIISDEIGRILFAPQEIKSDAEEILPKEVEGEDEIALILAIIEAIG